MVVCVSSGKDIRKIQDLSNKILDFAINLDGNDVHKMAGLKTAASLLENHIAAKAMQATVATILSNAGSQ
jgi:hypothetical protein